MNWTDRGEASGLLFVFPEGQQRGAQKAVGSSVHTLKPSRTVVGRHHYAYNSRLKQAHRVPASLQSAATVSPGQVDRALKYNNDFFLSVRKN